MCANAPLTSVKFSPLASIVALLQDDQLTCAVPRLQPASRCACALPPLVQHTLSRACASKNTAQHVPIRRQKFVCRSQRATNNKAIRYAQLGVLIVHTLATQMYVGNCGAKKPPARVRRGVRPTLF